MDLLAEVRAGRLREAAFPCVDGPLAGAATMRPTEVIVYFVGGCTYAEAREVAKLNAAAASAAGGAGGMRIILGSSHVLSSDAFLRHLAECVPGSGRAK